IWRDRASAPSCRNGSAPTRPSGRNGSRNSSRRQPSPRGGGHALKLVCSNVWKLLGGDAAGFLARSQNPSPDELRRAGLVAAVRAVDLEVCEGQIFVIMGLSGSGKSTLVRCLSRLVEPT